LTKLELFFIATFGAFLGYFAAKGIDAMWAKCIAVGTSKFCGVWF
jgi:hypothetical protein